MIAIELRFGGKELAKVVFYYGLSDLNETKIVCPFHNDVNPSMQLDYSTGKWYCYGCNAAGDALSFVKRIEKMDNDISACIKLVKILKSKKAREVKARDVVKKVRADSKQALDEANDYYYGLRRLDWSSQLDDDIKDVKTYMENRGFTERILNQSQAKYTYNLAYPIIFPILDNGEFKGWVCRTTIKAVEQKRKYLYNAGFSRATTLAGNYEARKTVMVVEGYMDMLKMRQFGVKHVVAFLGWKATDEQISKLKNQGVVNIISALDTDECGQKGTRYLSSFFNVIPFQFPSGVKDPGDLNKEQFTESYNKTIKLWRKTNNEHRRRN